MQKLPAFIFIILITMFHVKHCIASEIVDAPKTSILKNAKIDDAKNPQSKTSSFILENGLEIYVIPNHKIPAIAHLLVYKAGSIDENFGKTGLAHYLEHMMFKGTEKFSDGAYSHIIAENGGQHNAYTTYDYTLYFALIQKSALAKVMKMEADRMRGLNFDISAFDNEKKVILEERRLRLIDDPNALLSQQMKQALFIEHPYRRAIIGYEEDILNLSPDDLYEFYHKYYAPNNAILIIAGDITPEEAKQMVEKYYGEIEKSSIPEKKIFFEPKSFANQLIKLTSSQISKPQFARYYIAPSQNFGKKDDIYPLIITSYLLGGGKSGFLYQKLVEERKMAIDISAEYNDFVVGPAIFAINAIPAPDISLEELEKAIDEEIASFLKYNASPEDLKRTKYLVNANNIYRQESYKTLAFTYATILAAGISPDYIQDFGKNISSVTSVQINQAANDLFSLHYISGYLMEHKK